VKVVLLPENQQNFEIFQQASAGPTASWLFPVLSCNYTFYEKILHNLTIALVNVINA
jgi:hypothetical protein